MFDWTLTEEDQCNEVVRVVLNLGRVSEAGDGISEAGDEARVSNTTDVWLKKFNSNEWTTKTPRTFQLILTESFNKVNHQNDVLWIRNFWSTLKFLFNKHKYVVLQECLNKICKIKTTHNHNLQPILSIQYQ